MAEDPPTPVTKPFYQVDPVFPADIGGVAPDVFVLPPNFAFGEPTTVVISNVYRPPAPLEVPDDKNDDFVVSWHGPQSGTPTTANTTLDVVIQNANQWRSAPAARAALRSNFAALAELLDTMEFVAKSLVPGATVRILRRLAEALPAPLDESLFYYYGFNSGLHTAGDDGACPYVDLRPGMRLLVQGEPAQFVAPGAVPANGPTMAAPFPIDLSGTTSPADGFRRLVFDPFLAAMAAPTVPAPPLSSTAPQVIVGGLADLQAAGTARRYYRLLYPRKLPGPNQAGDGLLVDSITLIGADLRFTLDTATAAYQNGQPVTAGADALSSDGIVSPTLYWVLRGRATLVPQVQITLNQQPTWVSLGTTVRNLAEAFGLADPYSWSAGASGHSPVTVTRAGARQPIDFNVRKAVLTDPRVFDLPIVQGDIVTVDPSWA